MTHATAHHARLPLWDEKNDAQKLDAVREMVLDLYAYQHREARQRLLNILAQAAPADQREAESIAQMQELIRQHANIFAQNCEPGHVTGSALVVDVVKGRVLLILHKKLGLWLPVGGHGDDETDVAEIALREAQEETGLPDLCFYPRTDNPFPADFDVHTIPQSSDRPEHLHLDIRYLLATEQPDAVQIDHEESLDLRWMTFEEVARSVDVLPDVKRLTYKAEQVYQRMKGIS